MLLEGVVTNVAAFGAFVDVGVHQDGLVHVSAMSHTFVKDPREVVKSGDVVKVKVLEVDRARKRIALTMRLTDEAAPRPPREERRDGRDASRLRQDAPRTAAPRPADRRPEPPASGALADALRRAAERNPKR